MENIVRNSILYRFVEEELPAPIRSIYTFAANKLHIRFSRLGERKVLISFGVLVAVPSTFPCDFSKLRMKLPFFIYLTWQTVLP